MSEAGRTEVSAGATWPCGAGRMVRSGLAVISEQRCWFGEDGRVFGRKQMTALATLAFRLPCTVVARVAPAEPSGEAILPSEMGGVLIRWPKSWTDGRSVVGALVSLWRQVGRHSGVVIYCPGLLGSLAGAMALLRRRCIVAIAVGNPSEALSPEVVPGRAAAIAKKVVTWSMRLLCSRADVARYVTLEALQRAYPPGISTKSYGASDVGELQIGQIRSRPNGRCLVLLTVGTLDRPYKGISELIDAVSRVRALGHDLSLTVAGTGRLRPQLEQMAQVRLGESARFLGHITGDALKEAFSTADCFALASWTEGMPRALIEAMAAGLPAVGTAVGGVPELLEHHRLVAPRDTDALTAAIDALIADSDGWLASSRHNISAAVALVADAKVEDQAFVAAVATCLGAEQ